MCLPELRRRITSSPKEWTLKIDIKDLLATVHAIQTSGVRIGYPDEQTPVEIADPQGLSAALDDALCAFRDLRGGTDYLVDADANTYNRAVWVRFVQRGPSLHHGKVESALVSSFQALRDEISKSCGKLDYWGGNNYFNLSIPFEGVMRESFPKIEHLPWDERYRYELERTTWQCLRWKVFNFLAFAESFATRCVELGLSHVLIPSVGLCVHPWLFAANDLSVTATEGAATALDSLSNPDHWPRMYSCSAYARWEIAAAAASASQGNPDHFEQMPDLLNPAVRELLRNRINFSLGDWADLPLQDASVDAIFATNALPRECVVERSRVLREWVRVVRPGGLVFIAQHNFCEKDVRTVLHDAGWVETNLLAGERTPLPNPSAIGFQIFYSSG